MTPQAIQTAYAGHIFRSRLEARWAVFLDLLRVEWRYEYEGYELPSGRYLPDFWLPEIKTWLEIKPTTPTDDEIAKCRELAVATDQQVILMHGEFGWWFYRWLNDTYEKTDGGLMFCSEGGDCDYQPCFCLTCGTFGFEYEGRGDRACKRKCNPGSDRGHTMTDGRMRRAVEGALQRRFWAGGVG